MAPTTNRRLRRFYLAAVVVAAVTLSAAPAAAHPLGNFTVNTAARLQVGPEATVITYVLDLAEIPALQTRQDMDDEDRYRVDECARISNAVTLTVDGRVVPIRVEGARLSFPPGQAGLETLRLECDLRADTGRLGERTELRYTDESRGDRVGWREVTAVGDAATLLESDVPAVSPSALLARYPSEQLQSPLRVTTARLLATPGGASADAGGVGPVEQVDRVTDAFTALVSRQDLTPAFGLLAVGIAVLLGTAHALAPGHGKTVMAAYLVARRGAAKEALLLGATVAATHTVGVLVLGALLAGGSAVAPERLYPLLGALSGVLFTLVGLALLRPALRTWRTGEHGHEHAHPHGHGHEHQHGHEHGHQHGHGHGHEQGGATAVLLAPATVTAPASPRRSLVAPGLAGGLSPSPSALVVLLGGIALGRAWFGVLLVVAYGLGMAAALVGVGWLLLRVRGALAQRATRAPGWARKVGAALPVVTAALLVAGGAVIVLRALLTA